MLPGIAETSIKRADGMSRIDESSLRNGMNLIDAHVHLYSTFRLHRAFDSAARNFRFWRETIGLPAETISVMLLAEAGDDEVFRQLRSGSLQGKLGRWSVHTTDDAISLCLRRADGERLLLVAGHQITSAEGVEVLGLACASKPPDRLPLLDAMEVIAEEKGMPVLPWGFGKWIGRRGRIVQQIVRSPAAATRIALGDTSYRPRTALLPQSFRTARALGIPVYPGTDPLPFQGEEDKIGRYGLVLRASLDASRPGISVRDHLSHTRSLVEPYGTRESTVANLILQLRMQLLKRRRRSRARQTQ